jgi:hypothetical protein
MHGIVAVRKYSVLFHHVHLFPAVRIHLRPGLEGVRWAPVPSSRCDLVRSSQRIPTLTTWTASRQGVECVPRISGHFTANAVAERESRRRRRVRRPRARR